MVGFALMLVDGVVLRTRVSPGHQGRRAGPGPLKATADKEQSVAFSPVLGSLSAAKKHGGLPAFIQETFRACLTCGIPEHGFIRVNCGDAGHDDIVAFSCKRRGVRPSCTARAMGHGAAHLCGPRALRSSDSAGGGQLAQ